jgi:hypothetical protein
MKRRISFTLSMLAASAFAHAPERLLGTTLETSQPSTQKRSGNNVPGVTSVAPTAAGTRCIARLTQQGLERIAERHLFTTGAKNAGKFAKGTVKTAFPY